MVQEATQQMGTMAGASWQVVGLGYLVKPFLNPLPLPQNPDPHKRSLADIISTILSLWGMTIFTSALCPLPSAGESESLKDNIKSTQVVSGQASSLERIVSSHRSSGVSLAKQFLLNIRGRLRDTQSKLLTKGASIPQHNPKPAGSVSSKC